MRSSYTTPLLLTSALALSLPSCDVETVDAGDPDGLAFREVDICVLVNEPPSGSGDEAGDPVDLTLLPPCTDPEGCTDAATGTFYYTYFDEIGGFTNVSGDCPPPQPDPKVEAASQAEAVDLCQDLYGSLCRSLCACHGGVAVMAAGAAAACAESTGANTYSCGCSCDIP